MLPYYFALKASDIAQGRVWINWLARRVGTTKWVLAQRLTDNMRSKGYEVAIPQKRWADLEREFTGQVMARVMLAGRHVK